MGLPLLWRLRDNDPVSQLGIWSESVPALHVPHAFAPGFLLGVLYLDTLAHPGLSDVSGKILSSLPTQLYHQIPNAGCLVW